MEIQYRQGEKKDAAGLAELVEMASDGVVEYLFRDLVPGMSPVQIVAHNLENDNYPHTYKNAIVAADGNDVVGAALSYPSSYHRITDEMRRFFPAERLARLKLFFSSSVPESWYLDTLGVIESHRRRGIGEKLMALTREKAVANRFSALSLIVFADNQLALPLYERTGFRVVKQVELPGNDIIEHHEGCLLMKCGITT